MKKNRFELKPSVTKKRHADSSVKKNRNPAYQTRSNVQVEYDSSRTSLMKRKSSMGTSLIHQNLFDPEASIIESETSPKKNNPRERRKVAKTGILYYCSGKNSGFVDESKRVHWLTLQCDLVLDWLLNMDGERV
ncbi:hypothetical protein TNIN_209081 [Trichonephila inaurata madagascariensis]|uniref:Uncharacterized protein n=1 Tax=Trichonephila inaurata madagascariensis TaxID=2747483 RepID=A0A8X6K410_9ARAC|nr:hypothetical protein TNIN_209081 [Trichonephila inaurata madagascariensis]